MGVALLLRIVLYAVIFWLVNIRYVRVGIACGINSIFGPLLKLLSLPYAPAGNILYLFIYLSRCITVILN